MPTLPSIIPTPRHFTLQNIGSQWKAGATLRVAVTGPGPRQNFAARLLATQLRARFGLRTRLITPSAGAELTNADLVLCSDAAAPVAALLPAPLRTFESELALEQGYAIHHATPGPVILYAHTPTGLLYAIATLLQLLRATPQSIQLPNLSIKDWPEYRWRGNNWLLNCEISGWSYARGDGLRAFEQRVLRKLDWAALHKINLLIFDGFKWDLERFPGHTALMRRCNDAARLRGIRLSFGGYGAYYGGDQFINRRQYPAGAPYACLGYPNNEKSRTQGTCLSNAALTRQRQVQLARFVRAIRPGVIYLHNLDTGLVSESAPVWNLRCPACRKRWPSDEIAAPNGMAGAFADFYNAMSAAVTRADPDCRMIVVSPGYTAYNETDADWEKSCQYWLTVSRHMKNRDILIGLREQFVSRRGKTLRYAQLRRRLDEHARGHPIANIYFYGGDWFFNNHPFLATPILNHHFRGAEMIMNGSGSAYQEPLQLLHAETLWNPRGSRFFSAPPLQPFRPFQKRYLRLCKGQDRPREIFGKAGFLDVACAHLYGAKAGPLVAEMYRLRGSAKLGCPGFARFEETAVWLPVHNYLAPDARAFRHCEVQWRAQLTPAQRARIRRLRAIHHDAAALNQRGAALVRRAVSHCSDPHAAADLRWLADTLIAARQAAQLLAPFLDLFLTAHAAMSAAPAVRARVIAQLKRFTARINAFQRQQRRAHPRPVSRDEAELFTRTTAIPDRLRRLLDPMAQSLTTGAWPAQSPPRS